MAVDMACSGKSKAQLYYSLCISLSVHVTAHASRELLQPQFCFCRYGNFVAAPAASSLLVKVADHSGNQEGSVFDLSDATIVQYTCQQAGAYLEKMWLPRCMRHTMEL